MIDRNLTPSDAEVAIRTFPRRFRALLAGPDDEEGREDPDEIARRYGADGTSAVEHVLAADGLLAMLDRGVQQVRGAGEDTLHPSFGGLGAASWPDEGTPLPQLLDRLEGTAARAADRVGSVPTDRWGDAVAIAGQAGSRTLLELVQEVVAVVAGHLRGAEKVLAEVR